MKVFALTDEELTQAVLASRCTSCRGMGLRFHRAEDAKGEPVAGTRVPTRCQDCHGMGILLGLCRRYTAETVAARP
jgi:hypothetical protein